LQYIGLRPLHYRGRLKGNSMLEATGMSLASYVLALCLVCLLGIIGVWDLTVKYLGYGDETVSSIIRNWSATWPLIPLGVGMLLGHIFWR